MAEESVRMDTAVTKEEMKIPKRLEKWRNESNEIGEFGGGHSCDGTLATGDK